MCAKKIAPASFGALLQLPKDQLRDLVDKQPQLKVQLREFVIKMAGNSKTKHVGFMEIFGDEPPTTDSNVNPPVSLPGSQSPSTPTPTPLPAISPLTAA
jgi:symplekin